MISTHCNPHPAFWIGFYLSVNRLQKKSIEVTSRGQTAGEEEPPVEVTTLHLLNASTTFALPTPGAHWISEVVL